MTLSSTNLATETLNGTTADIADAAVQLSSSPKLAFESLSRTTVDVAEKQVKSKDVFLINENDLDDDSIPLVIISVSFRIPFKNLSFIGINDCMCMLELTASF